MVGKSLVSVTLMISALAAVVEGGGRQYGPEDVGPGELTTMGFASGEAYGITAPTAYVIPPVALAPAGLSQSLIFSMDGYVSARSGDSYREFLCPVYLPTGALIDSLKVMVFDGDDGGRIELDWLKWACSGSDACTASTTASLATGDVETPGYSVLDTGSLGETWRNSESGSGVVNYSFLRVVFSLSSPHLSLGPMVIWYRLQVSPAPATATFTDVPTDHWAFPFVEALAASGITAGCGGGNYCPDSPITRAEMAVYLAAALGLHWPDS